MEQTIDDVVQSLKTAIRRIDEITEYKELYLIVQESNSNILQGLDNKIKLYNNVKDTLTEFLMLELEIEDLDSFELWLEMN